jgi:hypothetical protein
MHTAKILLGLCVVPILWTLPLASQETSAPKDQLYSMALVASVGEMQKEWGDINDGDEGNRIRTDYHNLIVRKNPEITDDLPLRSDKSHFEYLDDTSLLRRYNKVKKGFSILEVHPMHNRGATLKIRISQSWVENHHGRLWIGISDWADVELHYDCEQQTFVVSGVKLGGI